MSAAEIAAKLTKAQRAMVLGAVYRERDTSWRPEGYYAGGDKRVRRALWKRGILPRYCATTAMLTPLGLEVRAILQAEQL